MKIVVDRELCQNHGQCTFAAPEIFQLDEHGQLEVLEDEPGEALRGAVEDAADACPVQAIRIEG